MYYVSVRCYGLHKKGIYLLKNTKVNNYKTLM